MLTHHCRLLILHRQFTQQQLRDFSHNDLPVHPLHGITRLLISQLLRVHQLIGYASNSGTRVKQEIIRMSVDHHLHYRDSLTELIVQRHVTLQPDIISGSHRRFRHSALRRNLRTSRLFQQIDILFHLFLRLLHLPRFTDSLQQGSLPRVHHCSGLVRHRVTPRSSCNQFIQPFQSGLNGSLLLFHLCQRLHKKREILSEQLRGKYIRFLHLPHGIQHLFPIPLSRKLRCIQPNSSHRFSRSFFRLIQIIDKSIKPILLVNGKIGIGRKFYCRLHHGSCQCCIHHCSLIVQRNGIKTINVITYRQQSLRQRVIFKLHNYRPHGRSCQLING